VPQLSLDPQGVRNRFLNADRLVSLAGAVSCVVALGIALVTWAAWGWPAERHPNGLLAAAAGFAVAAWLARRGQAALGGAIALAIPWMQVHLGLWQAQTFPTSSLLAAAAIVVAVSLLYVPRHSLVFTLLTVVATWVAVLSSPALAASGVTRAAQYWLVTHTVLTMTVWAIVSIGNRLFQKGIEEVFRHEQELADTIASAPDGIVIVDADMAIRTVNPAAEQILGITADACVGRAVADVLRDAGERLHAELGRIDRQTTVPHAARGIRRDGTVVHLEIHWRAMRDGRGQLVVRDVSERVQADDNRRAMEMQLSHSQRMEAIGQLAGGLAHDFNNLLTIIGGSAEVLRRDVRNTSAMELADEILRAQQRGAALTRQLLSFARRDVIDPRIFDVAAHVHGLSRLLQRVAGDSVLLSIDAAAASWIRADVAQVEQAVVNLVTNARDAMPQGGVCTIRIVPRTDDDGSAWIRLSVRDTGPGIESTIVDRVFEPFFTTKPRGRGTGLGLASVHSTLMRSGGRAVIDSAPGAGTTVHLDFPAQAAVARPDAERVPAAATPARVAHGSTILVVEDDDGTRAIVVRILEHAGFTVLSAADGASALQLMSAQPSTIDLLVTDVMMPGLRGPDLAAQLVRAAPETRVLFMSGYAEDALASVHGLRVETDFLAKPFSGDALLDRVRAKLTSGG
jgi:two-component system, cell cycle sensor histidine kinase and response regulator CckA